MKTFKNVSEAQNYFGEIANNDIEKSVDKLGFSINNLKKLSVDQLRVKLEEIDIILGNRMKIDLGTISFSRGVDFDLPARDAPGLVNIYFKPLPNLIKRKKQIFDIIKDKERETKIESISGLVKNISEPELKEKFSEELKKFKEHGKKLAIEEELINKEEQKISNEKEQLEISKEKLEILDNKSQIWSRILAKESIASIMGGFILLIMSLSLLAAMFFDIETTKIIESAFLLILGYFFGQAVSKK